MSAHRQRHDGPRLQRREFVVGLGAVTGVAVLAPWSTALSATPVPAAATAAGAPAPAWDVNDLTLSWPRYAEPIPYARNATAGTVVPAAEPLACLFMR